MEKLDRFLEEKMLPLGQKINSIRFLCVVRDAMMPLVPLIISGSIVLLLLNFPGIDQVVPAAVMEVLRGLLVPLNSATMGMLALSLVFGIGYNYARHAGKRDSALFSGIVSLASFFVVTPLSVGEGDSLVSALSMSFTGVAGMFVAIIIGYLAAKLFIFIVAKNLTIKMPDGVPPMVTKSFESLIPAFITLFAACVLNYVMLQTPFENVHALITTYIQKPLHPEDTSLPAMLVTEALHQFLWFFGLHGDNLVGSVMEPILRTADATNLEAFRAGESLPFIINQQFESLFVVIAFMSLVLACLIVGRSRRMRETTKLAAAPALFCISEPTVFGLPIIMNIYLLIPWVLVRPLFVLISYGFMVTGLCPAPTGVTLPWTCPPVISGVLATNSIMGGVVQIICIAVGVLLFIPFVKLLDKSYKAEESAEGSAEAAA